MDPSLSDELVNTPVEYYQKLLDNGVPPDEIELSLSVQLDELAPSCKRYQELTEWKNSFISQ